MSTDLTEPSLEHYQGVPRSQDPGEIFASSSVTVHVIRGLLGLVCAVGAFVLVSHSAWALLGLPAAAVLWRGCPTCWAMGLGRTISRGRVGRCDDGSCG